MGFTTKEAHDHLVGRHSEGLRRAALVSRDGYQVSMAASGCNWRFDKHTYFTSISCTVTPSQTAKVVDWADFAADMGRLRPHVERDVTAVIGAGRVRWTLVATFGKWRSG
jgi:hypothetical protein